MNLILWILSINIIISSLLLLSTSNRVHSILYLIYIYMCSSLVFMYLGLLIVGLFYFLVYIGAIAMLFLFSVMILDIRTSIYEKNYINYMIFGFLFIFLFLYLFFIDYTYFFYRSTNEYFISVDEMLKLLGILLFDYYHMVFIFAAILLVMALVGAIFITSKKFGYSVRREYLGDYESPLFRNQYIYLTLL